MEGENIGTANLLHRRKVAIAVADTELSGRQPET